VPYELHEIRSYALLQTAVVVLVASDTCFCNPSCCCSTQAQREAHAQLVSQIAQGSDLGSNPSVTTHRVSHYILLVESYEVLGAPTPYQAALRAAADESAQVRVGSGSRCQLSKGLLLSVTEWFPLCARVAVPDALSVGMSCCSTVVFPLYAVV
jgi:hypothetical protein